MRKIETLEKWNSAEFAATCEELLRRGHQVSFRANGESMQPNISNGDTVLIAPANAAEVKRGDIVLTHQDAQLKLHRVVACACSKTEFTTRGDSGQENDPATSDILGRLIAIRSGGKATSVTPATKYRHAVHAFLHRLKMAITRRVTSNATSLLFFMFLAGIGLLFGATPAAAQADLAVTVDTAAPTTQAPGGQITYTVTVINNGPNTANVPVVAMNTPSSGIYNTTYVSAVKTGGTGTWTLANPGVGNSGTISFTRTTNMNSGSTATFSFVVQLPATVPNGTIFTNSVNISSTTTDPTPANNTVTVSITVQAPDISMTQAGAPNPVATGANITYTETVTNNSATLQSFGASLTQNTPANTTFVSATPPAGWACGTVPAVGGTGAITCTANAALAVSSTTGNFSIVVLVNAGAPGGSNITNTATVSESGTDPNPANNTTTTSVAVISADLSMTQAASATAVAPGGTIAYTETVTNNGPNTAVGVTLYQQTPPNTVFASMTPPAGWTCGTAPAVGATGQVICAASANVNSGATSGNFSFVVTVNAGTAAGTSILNWADVTSQTTDPLSSNNATTTTVLVEVTGDADLSLSSTASPTPVFIASPISYSIQLQNLGLSAASTVVVTDTYPAGLVNPSATSSQGTCAPPTAGQIVCTIGTVAYPLATPITITLTGTTPGAATTLTNTAVVTTSTTDPVASNNTSTIMTVVQPLVCATPGKDGAPGALTGTINTYYAGVGTAAGGATSLTVATPSSGSATQIGVGDLLLVMQMQGAQINDTNTSSYGDGVPGNPASGSTNLGNSGFFEFVTVTNVATGAGTLTLTIQGTGGANSGLLNSYASVAASNTSTPPQGAQTFQVIRVPQYSSATLSSGLTALPWNGAVGGVLVLDVASQLTLGGTVSLDGAGFRGGGGLNLAGGAGAATDVVTLSTVTTNSSKGEGIAGTPHYVAPLLGTITLSTTAVSTAQTYLEGYPNGSFSRGAPANAGGGATDANPVANDQNSGGGAGANGGNGGAGGFGWKSAGLVGGFGGIAFPASTSAVIMGGGAGAGTTNNGTSWNPVTNSGPANNCGANCTGIYSSGAAGGGIVIIHAGSVIGTGTITANGQSALEVENDGGGGGGAGGTILVQANSGALGGLTLSAAGGNGGITWPENAPSSPFPGNRHGPGGGGGGGVIFTSSTPASESVVGGAPGTTTLANDAYGATVGQAGITATVVAITQTPGTQSGAYCAGADLSVTNSGSPNPVLPGGTISYTQTVANAGPLDALNAVFSESIPANTTFSSITAPTGWTCNSNASILSTGVITCTNPDVPSGVSGTGTFTVNVTVNPGTTFGTQIVDIATITAGTNDPNLANNSATATNIVGSASSAYLTLTKTAGSGTVIAGNNITYTMVITNNGPATESAGVFDSIPANTSFVSMSGPAGWSCSVPAVGATSGNLSCGTPSLANGASATITLVVTVLAATPNGTTITNTANANGNLPNPNPNAATATSNVLVASATQADLAVTTSASPNPVLIGNNITYAQTVTNNGPAAATSLTFTDVIPTGTTFVSIPTPPAGWSCSTPAVGATGTVTCTIASLAAGSTASIPLVVKVASTTTAGTTISNSPAIAATTSDPNLANNTATSTTIVASPSQADVTITKTASPEPVDQGTNLTYTIQLVNHGPSTATGVSVSDPLPTEVTFSSVSTSQGTCSQSAGTVSCTIGTMAVGGTVVVTINVSATTFSSSAVNCPPPSGPQFNACNTATLTTTSSNPNPAPVTASAGSTIQSPTSVQLSSFKALARSQGGVVLEWHTREEIRNLGFNIYRESAQGRQKINPSLIAGGALFVRGGRPQHSAKSYQWLDPAGSASSTYWIEDVDLNGTRTMHGPAQAEAGTVEASSAANSRPANALLLTQLNASVVPVLPKSGIRGMTPRPVLPIPAPREYRASLENMPAVKIAVSSEGWYRVSGAQLIAAGLDPNADVRDLQLYAEGIEQPLLLNGEQAGRVRSLGSIEFYGTGIDTPYSGERIYWLVENTRPGTRIPTMSVAPSGFAAPESFAFATVHEDRTTYFATLLNGEDNDNFFGAAVTSQPVDQDLVVANSDATSGIPITVDVDLQGGTDLQYHRVSVQFNGASIGELDFFGLANVTNTFPVDPSLLHDGINNVTLTALEGDNDVSLVQSITLHYPHRYVADSNWLRASAPAGSALHFAGFTSPQVRVFDITNPQSIVELKGVVALEGASYGVTLSASNPGPAERTLLAFTDDQISTPDALTHHQPATLAQHPRATDIVMITAPDFVANLAPLAKLHESEGRSVTVVTVDVIFDAFNFGERSPYAIRSYLQSLATLPSRKPLAVLLVGDASLDPCNYLGFGKFDFVPTRIIETQAFKTASDDWFTDFQQIGFATIATGRLPVRTAADADLVISKILGYEKGVATGSWNQQALMISDQNEGTNFSLDSLYAISNLPLSLKPTQIVADGIDPATARQQILAGLNNGALLVNYTGHGATEQWSFADLFDNNDAATLSNGQRLPFYLLMDCLNGFFHDVYSQSLAESLLLAPNGGAVAVWASSGFTTAPPQATMNQAMLHALQVDPSLSIGAAALQSKLAVTDKDVRRTWILFGDPAMKLQNAPQPHGRIFPRPPVNPPDNPGDGPIRVCPRCQIRAKPVE